MTTPSIPESPREAHELAPCPFCGAAAARVGIDGVCCRNCPALMPSERLWNRRSLPRESAPKASPEHAVPDDVLLRLADAVELFRHSKEDRRIAGWIGHDLTAGDLRVLLEAVRSLPRESVVSVPPSDEERERLAQVLERKADDLADDLRFESPLARREIADLRAAASLLRAAR